jgi:hypothetical protein
MSFLLADGVHLDLGADHGARLDGGARQHRVLELLAEHPVVAAEVAGVLEIGGHPHDVGQRRALLGENAADRLDRAQRLLLDRAGDHVAGGVLADLAGDEDVVAGAHRRMKWQVRVLLADRIDVLARAAGVVHAAILLVQERAVVSMMSTPRTRSTR